MHQLRAIVAMSYLPGFMNTYSHDQWCRRGAAWVLVLFAVLFVGLGTYAQDNALPVVGIVATREATSEPRPEARIAPGEFTIRRTGSMEQSLDVFVTYQGTATPERDFEKLPNSVTIPAGKAETTLWVVAFDDDHVEGEETVVAEIVQPPVNNDPLAGSANLPGLTYAIDSTRGRARVVIHDADRAREATIEWLSPEPGSRFEAGANIPIRVVAVDPHGYIGRVEFFSGTESIGVSEIVFIRAPDPGTPIEHTLDWEGAKPGDHVLMARAEDSAGNRVESKRVPVVVGKRSEIVIVGVEAANPRAAEPNGRSTADVGTFVIHRLGGPKDIAVPVYYSVGGEALNGVDYERLTGRAELPAGVDAVRVVVTPIADKAKEGEEKVVLELEPPICPAIFPPPPQCYRIAASGSAAVVIRDSEADTETEANRPPVVRIVSPRSGSAFVEGEVIVVRSEATDSDGTIERLYLYAEETLLGSTKEGSLTVEWKESKAGLHKLIARALDSGGREARSPVVTVFVRAIEEVSFVRRDLPPAYLPGSTVDVLLVVNPPRGGAAWTVEEEPPEGWMVSEISSDGRYDAATGKVKFGPFTDSEARRLFYRVAAPAGATGAHTFTGRASLDGRSLPVAGDQKLEPASEHHPADALTADKTIVADELTAYAAAWKRGTSWGTDGGSIPLTYVTRAGLIWRTGERYLFEATAGAPPTCWVPVATDPAAATVAGDEARSLAARTVGVAERDTPAAQRPGNEGMVEIRVIPPPGTQAVAVEESVPSGWQVSAISDDGVFDAASRRIRWGLFYGDAARRLTFKATPPSGVAGVSAWNGVISFDGTEVDITGVARVGAADASTLPRILGSRRGAQGKVHFQVDAPADQVLVIEGSDDLKTWMEVGAVVHTGGEFVVTDATGEASGARYYRLRPLSR